VAIVEEEEEEKLQNHEQFAQTNMTFINEDKP
jgi:hypothetical protein